MTTVSRSAVVDHSPETMFALVDDVDRYDEFLPWVKTATVLHRDESVVKGTLLFSKGGFEKSFTTENYRHPGEAIDIRLVRGPFRHLKGTWRFEPMGERGCKVALNMDFEFTNRLLAMAFGRVFTQMANSLVDSFVRRADSLYGRGEPPR